MKILKQKFLAKGIIKKLKKVLKSVWFVIYYVWLSSAIFALLLIFSNIKAYSNITYAYFNKNAIILEQENIESSLANTIISNSQTLDNTYKINLLKEELKKTLQKENEDFLNIDRLVNFDAIINVNMDIVPYENRIVIPKIWKTAPLVDVYEMSDNENILNNIFMQELAKWVVRYPWTAKPWEEWNAFIFWHSSNFPWIKWEYNEIFALLNNLENWDEIVVYYNQKKYEYIVKEKHVVKPWDTDVLDRDETKKELSLMTCWPIWTSINRLVVIAELQE